MVTDPSESDSQPQRSKVAPLLGVALIIPLLLPWFTPWVGKERIGAIMLLQTIVDNWTSIVTGRASILETLFLLFLTFLCISPIAIVYLAVQSLRGHHFSRKYWIAASSFSSGLALFAIAFSMWFSIEMRWGFPIFMILSLSLTIHTIWFDTEVRQRLVNAYSETSPRVVKGTQAIMDASTPRLRGIYSRLQVLPKGARIAIIGIFVLTLGLLTLGLDRDRTSPHSATGASANARSLYRGEIAARIKSIVSEHLGVESASVTDNARFFEDLGADELDLVELGWAFEEDFKVELPDTDIKRMRRVRDAVQLVQNAIENQT